MSRRLEDVTEDTRTQLVDVIDGARTAALSDARADIDDTCRAIEEDYPRPRTGHHLARLTGLAGAIAAHDLRLRAAAQVGAGDEPWTAALTDATAALSSWDWDERMQAALDLRRTFKDLPSAPDSVRPVRLVAAWLTHAGGVGLVTATAQLCAHVLNVEEPSTRGAAWFAVNGLAALDAITTGQSLSPGRHAATPEEAVYRARLRWVVAGVASAQILTLRELATRAGTTRPTITSWMRVST